MLTVCRCGHMRSSCLAVLSLHDVCQDLRASDAVAVSLRRLLTDLPTNRGDGGDGAGSGSGGNDSGSDRAWPWAGHASSRHLRVFGLPVPPMFVSLAFPRAGVRQLATGSEVYVVAVLPSLFMRGCGASVCGQWHDNRCVCVQVHGHGALDRRLPPPRDGRSDACGHWLAARRCPNAHTHASWTCR